MFDLDMTLLMTSKNYDMIVEQILQVCLPDPGYCLRAEPAQQILLESSKLAVRGGCEFVQGNAGIFAKAASNTIVRKKKQLSFPLFSCISRKHPIY